MLARAYLLLYRLLEGLAAPHNIQQLAHVSLSVLLLLLVLPPLQLLLLLLLLLASRPAHEVVVGEAESLVAKVLLLSSHVVSRKLAHVLPQVGIPLVAVFWLH